MVAVMSLVLFPFLSNIECTYEDIDKVLCTSHDIKLTEIPYDNKKTSCDVVKESVKPSPLNHFYPDHYEYESIMHENDSTRYYDNHDHWHLLQDGGHLFWILFSLPHLLYGFVYLKIPYTLEVLEIACHHKDVFIYDKI